MLKDQVFFLFKKDKTAILEVRILHSFHANATALTL